MKIGAIYILPENVEPADRSKRSHSAALDVSPKGRNSVRPSEDRYLGTDSVIDAEYVETYSPVHRPSENQQWRNLVVEQGKQTTQHDPENATREQLFTKRYSRNSSVILPPGSHINLFA